MSKRKPSYRLHKPSGQAIVTLSGKMHYLGEHNSPASLQAYERLIAEWQIRERQAEECKGWTCDQLIVAFLEHAQKYYRKNGRVTDEYSNFKTALKYVSRLYGETPANQFGPLKLKVCREVMIEGRFSRKPLSRKFINKCCNRIRHVFKWGVQCEQVRPDVLEGLRSLSPLQAGRTDAVEREPVSPVDTETLEKTTAHLRPMIADMVAIQILSGMRPGELCRLSPREIDRSESIWQYAPLDHKMSYKKRVRLVPIGPKAQQILSKYLFGDVCFLGNRGDQMTTEGYRDAIHRACNKAGVERWSPNQLRHNAATEISKQFGLEVARAVLSHSNISTTAIYAEEDFGVAKKVAQALG